MNVGGYQIIDLKNFPFDTIKNNSVVIEGIYDKIESTLKPILLTGMVVDDIEVRNQFVTPRVSGSEYGLFVSGNAEGFQGFTINSNDVVTMIII